MSQDPKRPNSALSGNAPSPKKSDGTPNKVETEQEVVLGDVVDHQQIEYEYEEYDAEEEDEIAQPQNQQSKPPAPAPVALQAAPTAPKDTQSAAAEKPPTMKVAEPSSKQVLGNAPKQPPTDVRSPAGSQGSLLQASQPVLKDKVKVSEAGAQGAEYFEVALWMDNGMKLENFLTDTHNIFYFASVYELVAYFLQILFFLGKIQVNTVWFQILGLVHVVRAFLGLYIARNLPRFNDLTMQAQLKGDVQLGYDDCVQNIPKIFRHLLWDYYHPIEVKLKIYSIGSLVCLLLDCLASLIFLIFCGKLSYPEAWLTNLLIVSIYFYTDILQIVSVVLFRFRLPVHLQKCAPKAIVGWGSDLKAQFAIPQ